MNLKPIYKWTGGKRKEIKIFSKYYPKFINDYTLIEPFFGGGAVYWDINNDNIKKFIINDLDYDLINFLNNVKYSYDELNNELIRISNNINEISIKEKNVNNSEVNYKEERGKIYYNYRNMDRNNGLSKLSSLSRAIRFYIVNQLSFNGMRRFNSKGEFNVPYGNYKSLPLNLTLDHKLKLDKTTIMNDDYKNVILNNDNENTFIFIDPPYTREFKEYSSSSKFGNDHQIELFNIFKNIKKAFVMIIINKDEFTYNLYKDYIKDEYDLKYSTNIKNRFDNNVKHLIITNYDI